MSGRTWTHRRLCRGAVLGWLAMSVGLDPALGSISQIREGIAAATLSGGQVPAEQRDFRLGHLHLDLADGDLHALTARGLVVGLFFRGRGQFRYVSDDQYERSSWAVNVKRVTGFKVEGNAVAGAFDKALILDSRMSWLFTSMDSLPPGEPSAETRSALARFRQRFAEDRGLDAVNCLTQALVEGSDRPFVSVLLDTGKKHLAYTWDALRSLEEALAVMEPFGARGDLSGARWAQEVSNQRLNGDRLQSRPIPWVLRHVDIDLRNPSDRRLELRITETIDVSRPLHTLDFGLWTEGWDKGLAQPYHLRSVTLADGSDLDFIHERGDLVVELPRPIAAGETIELTFELEGDILVPPGDHSFWWLPIGSWFPRPTRLDQSSFTYRGTARVAKPFLPFSMGRTVRRWEEDGMACAEFELDLPIQFVVMLAGKYHFYEETREGLTIRLASYAFSQNDTMRKIADNSFQLIDFYEPILGDFPFPELTILEINSYGFGIAPPGVIYLTREAFDPSPAGRRYRAELNLRMAHEVAHMWWGHVAQMASPEEQWLSESTAEYYAALAVGKLLGQHKFKAAQQAWKQQAGAVRSPESIYLANRIAGEKAYLDRYGLLYAKGPLMFHELREELGDKLFLTLLKSSLTNFHHRHITTREFIELTNFITQRDFWPWYAQHLFGME